MEKEPYRHLNLLVPASTYKALRKYSFKTGKPYAVIVREAIGLLFESVNTNKRSTKDES